MISKLDQHRTPAAALSGSSGLSQASPVHNADPLNEPNAPSAARKSLREGRAAPTLRSRKGGKTKPLRFLALAKAISQRNRSFPKVAWHGAAGAAGSRLSSAMPASRAWGATCTGLGLAAGFLAQPLKAAATLQRFASKAQPRTLAPGGPVAGVPASITTHGPSCEAEIALPDTPRAAERAPLSLTYAEDGEPTWGVGTQNGQTGWYTHENGDFRELQPDELSPNQRHNYELGWLGPHESPASATPYKSYNDPHSEEYTSPAQWPTPQDARREEALANYMLQNSWHG